MIGLINKGHEIVLVNGNKQKPGLENHSNSSQLPHTRENSPDEGHGDGDEEGVELVERLLGLVDLRDQLAVVVLVLQGRVELGQSAIRKKQS